MVEIYTYFTTFKILIIFVTTTIFLLGRRKLKQNTAVYTYVYIDIYIYSYIRVL